MAAAAVDVSAQAAQVIPIASIRADANVRRRLDNLESLAESIARHGVLTAITVTRGDDGSYELLTGFRRVAAATMAGLTTIAAVVRDPADPADRLEKQLAENIERDGLDDLSRAEAIQQLLGLGIAAEEIARTTHTHPDNVQLAADGVARAGGVRATGDRAQPERLLELARSIVGVLLLVL